MIELFDPGGLLYAIVLIGSFVFFARFRPLRDLSLSYKLKLLFATEALIVIVTQSSSLLGDVFPPLRWLLLYYSILGVVIFFLLKDLMFFRQSRYTRTMFLFLSASLVALIVVGLWRKTSEIPIFYGWIIPVVIMVGAALENQWIHFLNRRQKVWVTLGAIIMLAAVLQGGDPPAQQENASLPGIMSRVFYIWLWMYMAIYTGIAAVTLIVHLPGAGIVDRQRQQLNSLQSLSSMVSLDQPQSAMLDQIVQHICEDVNINRAWLFWRNDPSQPFELGAFHGLLPREEQQLRHALRGDTITLHLAEPIILHDLEKNKQLSKFTPDTLDHGSQLIMPLISPKIGLLGVLMAYRDYPYAFDRRELDLVLSLSMQGVVALENARFFKQALESQRLEQELTLAKSIQQRLLPNRMPDLRGVEIAAINIPCYAVGGDYYDILSFEDNTLSVVIADVAGKGIPASLLMANLQASFRLLAGERASCDSLVTRLNSVIFENMTRDKFISFFYCTVNPEESRLEYCNAGHNYPMLFRKNGAVEHLKTGGLVLGALPDFSYQRAAVAFEPGDVCVLYTDGVSEAMNQMEDEYSEINLQKVVQHHRENSAAALADTILQSVKSHMNGKEQQDDITLIVLRRTGAV